MSAKHFAVILSLFIFMSILTSCALLGAGMELVTLPIRLTGDAIEIITKNKEKNTIIERSKSIMRDEICESTYNIDPIYGKYSGISNLLVMPDSSRFITVDTGRKIKLWDLHTGAFITYLVSPHAIDNLAISSSEQYIVTSGFIYDVNRRRTTDGWFTIFYLPDRKIIRTIRAHTHLHSYSQIVDIKITQDSNYIVSASENGEIKLWNLQTGNLLNTIQPIYLITSVATHPQNKHIYVATDKNIVIIDFSLNNVIRKFNTEFPIRKLLSLNNEYLIGAHYESKISVFKIENNTIFKSYILDLGDKENRIISMNKLDNNMISIYTNNNKFEIWDIILCKRLDSIIFDAGYILPNITSYQAFLSPSGKHIGFGTAIQPSALELYADGELILWDAQENKKIYTVNGGLCPN